ncbi:hypothetical protein FB451DRAFT_1555282 [Mycena latifolia]|nr:hypothetical protein FB451DRAFT_1555282 [Mycena latifolia]
MPKLYCSRDLLGLVEKGLRLLEIKRSASMIQCQPTGDQYRHLEEIPPALPRHLRLHRESQGNSDLPVQLIVEAERQRRYTDDISETVIILTNVRSHDIDLLVSQPNVGNAQSSMSVFQHSGHPRIDTAA